MIILFHLTEDDLTIAICVSNDSASEHIRQLKKLKKMGGGNLVIEYSNFERLLDLEIDFLKIDAKYIKNLKA